ncbi:histone-lysine N-methyltransferase family member SUVH9-like protein [Tanacetum coccineum]
MASSLIDLNLYPDPIDNPKPIITPKIKPKSEPIDDVSHTLNPNPNPNPTPIATIVSHDDVADNNNVLSEYNRIQELFRTAFPAKLEQQQTFDDVTDTSQAIVPIPDYHVANNNNGNGNMMTSSRRKSLQRSSELVRVTNLAIDDEMYFRGVVRKTRMIYDSLRVLVVMEDALGSRARGDLKAASVMKDRGLWLNRDKRIVDAIPGVHVGDVFFFRMELYVVGMHGQAQAEIDYLMSSQSFKRESIARSVIDTHSRHVVHQKLEGGNLAMEGSMHYEIEVRVIRGFKYERSASGKVYVYDGLYKILEAWFDVGKSGFGVFKFKLVRIVNQVEMGSAVLKFANTLRVRPLEARPVGYVSFDISMKKENVPVFLFNDIDNNHEPMYYEYLATTVFPKFVYHLRVKGSGCSVSGCTLDCLCAKKNGGEFAYDANGLLVRGKPLIFECGPHCCCPPGFQNRVSQKGVRNRFEVFRSWEKGWGVRSLDLIQADSGDLSQIFTDYVHPSYPSIRPLDYGMDVSRVRNLACYMSHSACPNVLVQLVLYEHLHYVFPHLMLFAMENIPPLRELSLDYGAAPPNEASPKLEIYSGNHDTPRLACKEINVGGHRGWRLRIVEAFIIILAFTELLYVMLVHAGLYNSRYGPGYRDSDYGVGVGGHHHVEEPGFKGTTRV